MTTKHFPRIRGRFTEVTAHHSASMTSGAWAFRKWSADSPSPLGQDYSLAVTIGRTSAFKVTTPLLCCDHAYVWRYVVVVSLRLLDLRQPQYLKMLNVLLALPINISCRAHIDAADEYE